MKASNEKIDSRLPFFVSSSSSLCIFVYVTTMQTASKFALHVIWNITLNITAEHVCARSPLNAQCSVN